MVKDTEMERAEAIRLRIKSLSKDSDSNLFTIAKLLLDINKRGVFKCYGWDSMREYVFTADLGAQPETAYSLLRIARRADKLKYSWERLHAIGYAKARLVLIGTAKEHVSKLLATAEISTIQQTRAAVNALRVAGSTQLNVFTVRGLTDDQYSLLMRAMEHASGPGDADKLAGMAGFFLQTYSGKMAA